MSHTKLKQAFHKLQKQASVILSDESPLSSIERDYLKQLTLQFYDALCETEETKAVEIDLRDLQDAMHQPDHLVRQAAPRAPQVTDTQIPAMQPEPVVKRKEVQPEPPVESINADVLPTKEAQERVEIDAQVDVEDTAYQSLFENELKGDLSDRLSLRPIDNISKAMGVNERIFMMNELFNGDSAAFDRHIEALNTSDSFATAKQYIIEHIITQYDWSNDAKAVQAKDFIKLVRRRHPEMAS